MASLRAGLSGLGQAAGFLKTLEYYSTIFSFLNIKKKIIIQIIFAQNSKGLQKARGPARAHFWMGQAIGPNLGPARRAGLPRRPAT